MWTERFKCQFVVAYSGMIDHAFAPRKNLEECLGEGNTLSAISSGQSTKYRLDDCPNRDALQCCGMQLDWMQKSEQSVEHYKNSKHSQIWGKRMSKNASALSGNSNNHPHNLDTNTKRKQHNIIIRWTRQIPKLIWKKCGSGDLTRHWNIFWNCQIFELV